jgi:hypothetical protein
MGRPPKLTPLKLKQLEEAFALGCSDLEACLYADICKTTLYKYQELNPEFVNRKERLKENPVLKARTTFVGALDQPEYAVKYLERKKKDEFSLRTETQLQNDPENPIQMVIIIPNVQIGQKD